jgi:hypothetical protein
VILSEEVEGLAAVAKVREEEARTWLRECCRDTIGRRADRDMLMGCLSFG